MLQEQIPRWTCENIGLEIRKYSPTKHVSMTEKTEKRNFSYIMIGGKKGLVYLVIHTQYSEVRRQFKEIKCSVFKISMLV